MSLAAPTGSPAPAPILNSGTYTYFPGVYTSQVSISATNAVFTSGIYIFKGGIQVQGASTLTSSPAVSCSTSQEARVPYCFLVARSPSTSSRWPALRHRPPISSSGRMFRIRRR